MSLVGKVDYLNTFQDVARLLDLESELDSRQDHDNEKEEENSSLEDLDVVRYGFLGDESLEILKMSEIVILARVRDLTSVLLLRSCVCSLVLAVLLLLLHVLQVLVILELIVDVLGHSLSHLCRFHHISLLILVYLNEFNRIDRDLLPLVGTYQMNSIFREKKKNRKLNYVFMFFSIIFHLLRIERERFSKLETGKNHFYLTFVFLNFDCFWPSSS